MPSHSTLWFLSPNLRRTLVLLAMLLPVSSLWAEAAPDWQLQTLNGESIGLSDFRGEVVLVDFWASWCVPCRGSMGALEALQEEFAGRKVRILPISVDEDLADAQGFLRRYGPNLGSAHDPQGKVAAAYKLLGMPSSFVIDQQGRLILRHEGYRKGDADVWRQTISSLLHAQP